MKELKQKKVKVANRKAISPDFILARDVAFFWKVVPDVVREN